MLNGAVGEKVLVYADDVALYQRVWPVAVHKLGLCLCAECEEVPGLSNADALAGFLTFLSL